MHTSEHLLSGVKGANSWSFTLKNFTPDTTAMRISKTWKNMSQSLSWDPLPWHNSWTSCLSAQIKQWPMHAWVSHSLKNRSAEPQLFSLARRNARLKLQSQSALGSHSICQSWIAMRSSGRVKGTGSMLLWWMDCQWLPAEAWSPSKSESSGISMRVRQLFWLSWLAYMLVSWVGTCASIVAFLLCLLMSVAWSICI